MDNTQNKEDWRSNLKKINEIEQHLLNERFLGSVLEHTSPLVVNLHNGELMARHGELVNDYNLMCEFLKKGYKDDKRKDLYDSLVSKTYKFLRDLHLEYVKAFDPQWSSHLQYQHKIAFRSEDIRQQLESFVSEVAMLSLSSGEQLKENKQKLYANHHQYMQELFDAILLSPQWNHDFAEDMADTILSPTIDIIDALVLISAMMLGACINKDPERFLALTDIYEKSTDVKIKQRALVAWVFSIDDNMISCFKETKNRVRQLIENVEVRQELLELQMQVVYCRNAKRDNERLQQEIMPTIMENQNLDFMQQKDKSKEDYDLEEILHPDADDKKMENLEESIRKMMDMRDKGVDIYFSGFSQMKRFSFFYTLCNWFMPYSSDHPHLSHLAEDFMRSGMVTGILSSGSFCDSDKYSFVLGTSSIFHKLPQNILDALKSGEATLGIMGDSDINTSDPHYIRRMYLQDLYRFFTLSDFSKLFPNPFDSSSFLFLIKEVFRRQMGNEARKIQRFLLKQKMFKSLSNLFFAYKELDHLGDMRMEAYIRMRNKEYSQALHLYSLILEKNPQDEKALAKYAQVNFIMGDYEEAAKSYAMLLQNDSDNVFVALNHAISQINIGQTEEAVKELFRLNYEHPEDLNIKRALAWGLLWQQKLEQAEAQYQEILNQDKSIASDFLHAGYCQWFAGNVDRAISLIGQSCKVGEWIVNDSSGIYAQFEKDNSLFELYEIDETERLIIADMAFRH